jgi:N-acetylglucosaminyldiphosphoundecaprenol N-acetyl-beta-D-mannosaminyltransferase
MASSYPREIPQCTLMGMRFDAIGEDSLLDHIFASLAQGHGGWLVTANLDFLRRHQTDARARSLYDAADLRVADGMPLVWAARLQGEPLPERVAGSSLTWRLAERAAAGGRSLYLLGGSPAENQKAAQVLLARYPGLRLSGRSAGRFASPPTNSELAQLAFELLPLQPDFLYVGLSSPKQELVIEALRPQLPRTWMIGVGASIGFISGYQHRAPPWMQRAGLEWLHRLAQDPSRLARRYLMDDLPFALRLLSGALRQRLGKLGFKPREGFPTGPRGGP